MIGHSQKWRRLQEGCSLRCCYLMKKEDIGLSRGTHGPWKPKCNDAGAGLKNLKSGNGPLSEIRSVKFSQGGRNITNVYGNECRSTAGL